MVTRINCILWCCDISEDGNITLSIIHVFKWWLTLMWLSVNQFVMVTEINTIWMWSCVVFKKAVRRMCHGLCQGMILTFAWRTKENHNYKYIYDTSPHPLLQHYVYFTILHPLSSQHVSAPRAIIRWVAKHRVHIPRRLPTQRIRCFSLLQ
jgi:hypothetical protein